MRVLAASLALVELAAAEPQASPAGVSLPPPARPRPEPAQAAPAPVTPELERQADALFADVERLVAARASLGWVVDRVELDDMYPSLLETLCPAAPGARQLAHQRLERESSERGDPRVLYQADRDLTSRVKAALAAQRRLLAFEHGLAGVERDCPFWLG